MSTTAKAQVAQHDCSTCNACRTFNLARDHARRRGVYDHQVGERTSLPHPAQRVRLARPRATGDEHVLPLPHERVAQLLGVKAAGGRGGRGRARRRGSVNPLALARIHRVPPDVRVASDAQPFLAAVALEVIQVSFPMLPIRFQMTCSIANRTHIARRMERLAKRLSASHHIQIVRAG